MRTAIISGTFDPVTVGHYDIIKRASKLFGKVVVAVSASHYKDCLFDADTRAKAVSAAISDIENAEAAVCKGLLADFCEGFENPVIVRGARSCADFEYEYSMYGVNKAIAGLESVILPADETLAHVSSSFAREMIKYGRPLEGIVPDKAIPALKAALKNE